MGIRDTCKHKFLQVFLKDIEDSLDVGLPFITLSVNTLLY